MAYLLEFPQTPLPDNIRKPPYVVFGINGISVVDRLPPRIPLNAVLHFLPKLAQYVLPAPENLPIDVVQGTLRTPYVGIDIPLDIGIASFQRIIFKLIQAAGMAIPKHQFQRPPTTITSISIRKTWLLLDLPPAGLDNLLIHLQTHLMTGPPVTFTEIKELWAAFPSDSNIIRAMAVNFVQAHISLYYHSEDFFAIRRWYMAVKDRRRVFKLAEDQFPEFESRRMLREAYAPEETAGLALMRQRLDALEQYQQEEQRMKKAKKVDELNKSKTIRKSMKLRLTKGLEDEATNKDEMSARKAQSEREANVEHWLQGTSVETLLPTVYDPSKAST